MAHSAVTHTQAGRGGARGSTRLAHQVNSASPPAAWGAQRMEVSRRAVLGAGLAGAHLLGLLPCLPLPPRSLAPSSSGCLAPSHVLPSVSPSPGSLEARMEGVGPEAWLGRRGPWVGRMLAHRSAAWVAVSGAHRACPASDSPGALPTPARCGELGA